MTLDISIAQWRCVVGTQYGLLNFWSPLNIANHKCTEQGISEDRTDTAFPGMYFVPQYWFALRSKTWSVLYNIPMSKDKRIEFIDKVWKELQIAKTNFTLVYWNNPRYKLLKQAKLK